MTRRKRTPSPDRSQKRVAFDIPPSLAHLSVLSRSLAASNGVNQEKENSSIVARAQALSQSPTDDDNWHQSTKVQPKQLKFKYDARQFPQRQQWPQPMPNSGAAGHARFLEKQWQATQVAEAAEDMRAHMLHQQTSQRPEADSRAPTRGDDQAAERAVAALGTVSGNTPRQKPFDSMGKPQRDLPDSQPWSKNASYPFRPSSDVDIEQRRQTIIANLMKSKPASIATSSTNLQIPTVAPPQHVTPRPSEKAGDADSPLSLSTQSHQLAELIERKRAENAANGTLNRWLAARAGHVPLHQVTNQVSPQTREHSSPQASQPAPNPFIFTPHPSNIASQYHGLRNIPVSGNKESSRSVQPEETSQDPLASLFSSPAPSPGLTQEQDGGERGDEIASKDDQTQLPSPSLSVPSQDEPERAPSPSAQLLMNLANAAPTTDARYARSQQQHQQQQQPQSHTPFRTPSLSVSTQGLIRTSSAPRQQRASLPRQSISLDDSLTPQQKEMKLMQKQAEQQTTQHNMQQYQQMAAQAQAVQAQQYGRPQSQQSMQKVQSQQPMSRPQSSSSMTANATNSGYYKIKPHLWDAFSTDNFKMSPPNYVSSNAANLLNGNASGASSYPMSSMDSFSTSSAYDRPRGAGYSSFANGGGANANFRMTTRDNFGVPKR